MTRPRIATVAGLDKHPIMRAKYACDRCGARFTTSRDLVDNETPYQRVVHSWPPFDRDHPAKDYKFRDLCVACFWACFRGRGEKP